MVVWTLNWQAVIGNGKLKQFSTIYLDVIPQVLKVKLTGFFEASVRNNKTTKASTQNTWIESCSMLVWISTWMKVWFHFPDRLIFYVKRIPSCLRKSMCSFLVSFNAHLAFGVHVNRTVSRKQLSWKAKRQCHANKISIEWHLVKAN